MSQQIEVVYQIDSTWFLGKDSDETENPLPFELEDIHDWFIKYDTLNVQHTPDSEWVRYEPHHGAEYYDFKRPDEVYVNGEKVE